MFKQRTVSLLAGALLLAFAAPLQAAAAADVPLDAAHFPDQVFRDYLSAAVDQDKNGVLSAAECENVEEIVLSDSAYSKVTDLTGLEYFPELGTLRIDKTGVRKLDVSKNENLWYLSCTYAQLPTLDLENNPDLDPWYAVNQSIGVEASFVNGAWQVDLGKLTGADKLSRVRVPEGFAFSNGIVTVPNDPEGKNPNIYHEPGEQGFFYYYDTKAAHPGSGAAVPNRGQSVYEMPVYVYFSTTIAPTPAPAPSPAPDPAPAPSPVATPQPDYGSGVNGFVNRLYGICLGRKADDAGFADWTSQLKSGQKTGTDVAHGFIFSPEFQNKNYCNEHYVSQLYRAFLGREPDDAGLKDWVGRMESGQTREEIFNGFVGSQEFTNLCAGYGIVRGNGIAVPQYGTVPKGACAECGKEDGVTSFVKRLYNVCLDRDADTAGLKDWTNRLWGHTASGRDVAEGFIFSREFKAKNYDSATYVEYLYRAFFDREADAAGKADWLNRMAGGWSREQVFDGFVGSQEFDRLCKRYGIMRG